MAWPMSQPSWVVKACQKSLNPAKESGVPVRAIFRYTREDNEQAHRFFEQAVRLDPTFSRPYSGF